MSKSAVLTASNVVKTYGRVVALDGADLELFPGEVLAVIGDNGAGKSTLIKCLSGAEVPDNGSIEIDGSVVTFRKHRMVEMQELKLCTKLWLLHRH